MAIHSRIPRLIAVVASIAIATLTLYSQMVSAGYMYCTYDAHIEPTIGEIVQTVLPSVDIDMEKHLNSMYETLAQSSTGPGSKNKKKGTKKQTSKDQGADREGKLSSMHEQLVSAGAHGVQRVSALPVPIRSLFSTGLYTIDLRSNDYVSFNDVYLLQQNYWSLSVICTASAATIAATAVSILITICTSVAGCVRYAQVVTIRKSMHQCMLVHVVTELGVEFAAMVGTILAQLL
jgi:hypothetical protein